MDDKLIKSIDIFQRDDKLRPSSLKMPFINDNYLYVLYDSSLCVRTKLQIDETPFYDKVSNEHTDALSSYFGNSLWITIPVGALSSLLDIVNNKKDSTCDYCDGTGEAECSECGTMVECKQCNGTGKRDKPYTKRIKINDDIYCVGLWNKIIELCGLNNIDVVYLIHKHNYIHTFQAGRYEFVMSKYLGDDYDVCIKTKEKE